VTVAPIQILLLLKQEIEYVIKRIMVATDGSESATRAVKVAIYWARKFNARLIALHVITIPPTAVAGFSPRYATPLREYLASARKEGQKIVDEVVKSAKTEGVKVTPLIPGYSFSVVETIVKEASLNSIDLIVIGTRGLTPFKKLLIGSVSSGVLHHSDCPVLMVR
jgi:nucleotide-binding universal stress UspA family protein